MAWLEESSPLWFVHLSSVHLYLHRVGSDFHNYDARQFLLHHQRVLHRRYFEPLHCRATRGTLTFLSFSLFYTDMCIQSITPLLIIVRVGLGLTHGSQTEQYPSTRPSFARGPRTESNALGSVREPDEEYDMPVGSFGASSNTIVGEESSALKHGNDAFLTYYMS